MRRNYPMQGRGKREREWLAQACSREQPGGEQVKASVPDEDGEGGGRETTGDQERGRGWGLW